MIIKFNLIILIFPLLTVIDFDFATTTSSGFVCDIFHKAFVMEQKDEIEAVFDKTSYDWKNRLASPIKAKYLFKVETCLCPFGKN